ncbi:raffinose/stachyose/melibiose transport system substrate-binding protein [Paenibacillus sp. yr247]|uniref:ABC transporter substrate-binding protein n=1 Tax=Paenibacillus sp. yr247 TaxID=1761880 RepID=UPI00088BCB96|nr:extracellular solute-binding protein [Paenibacillus sp. yr247]SDP03467.1 raffinose/stachyose/melibiose transport system substrate-binding protein [Paenibacillus sp. yr247]
MKKTLTKSTGIALTLALTLGLTACGTGNGDAKQTATASAPNKADTQSGSATPSIQTVKLRIYAKYFDDDTKKPYDYAVSELKKAMPNIELELDPYVQDNSQKLKTYAATGNLPDIFDGGLTDFQTFNNSKNILVLDNEPETAAFKKDLNPGNEPKVIAPDGHVYAYPYSGIEFQILYYNKKLFADAGVQTPIKTVDQWVDAAKKFKAKGIIPLSIFAKEKWIADSFYKGLVTREEPKGYAVINQNGVTQLPDAFKLAAQQMQKLQEAGLFDANATNANYDQASSLFYQGKAAMFVNGQWEIYSAQKNMGDNVDWMYSPAKDEATYDKMKYYMDGSGEPSGFALSATTKHKDEAVKVAAFMARKYAEFKYSQLGNPIVSVKVDKPLASDSPAMMQRLVKETLPNIKGFAGASPNNKINNALGDNTQNILVKGFTADQFVQNMNRVLAQENK